MRPGREIDARVAQDIFGHEVFAKNKVLHERAEKGERPLKNYSKDMEWAWQVADKMRISLIPVDGGMWFAFAGKIEGWENPQALLKYLENGDFSSCGAAVSENAAEAICKAALVAHEKRNSSSRLSEVSGQSDTSEPPTLLQ